MIYALQRYIFYLHEFFPLIFLLKLTSSMEILKCLDIVDIDLIFLILTSFQEKQPKYRCDATTEVYFLSIRILSIIYFLNIFAETKFDLH